MKKGDSILIHLHGHDESVPGTIVEVLKDNFIRATIHPDHHLAMLDDQPRVITCSPDMYEVLRRIHERKGKQKK